MALPSNNKRKIFDGRYEVLSIVGRGTDSVVYHARHVQGAQQEVALKVLLNQKSQISLSERLRKEALTLVSCRHKYVVRLDDFHSVDDLCYLSMEFASQGDLRKVLTGLGTAVPVARATKYLRQCLEALDFIHATGVIHRDIKLDNILVLNDEEVRLADFGLALLPGDEVDIEELKNGAGSFAYLPPELVEGIRYDERSDLYALGLCFYEALAGFHPFDNLPIAEQLEARKDGRIPPLHEIQPSVPRNVSDVIAKLMRYHAEDRFRTALDAIRALDNAQFALEEPVQAVANSTSPVQEKAPSVTEPSIDHAANNDPDFDTEGREDDGPAFDAPQSARSSTSQRVSQPTEEIDLERIKEILARDSEQKSAVAARRDAVAEEVKEIPTPQKQERYRLEPKPAKKREAKQLPTERSRMGRPAMLPLRRLISVGITAAALTIVAVAALKYTPSLSLESVLGFFQRSSSSSSVATVVPIPAPASAGGPTLPANFDPSLDPSTLGFPVIPGGLYSGGIEGVIPGVRSPLALISLPTKGEVAVIVGVDGWAPSLSSSLEEGATENHTLVVRSNGVILNLSGELSSDVITGTFVNTMTGESGTWSVKKVS